MFWIFMSLTIDDVSCNKSTTSLEVIVYSFRENLLKTNMKFKLYSI